MSTWPEVSTMSFLTATTLIYSNGAGITVAAGTRLTLQYILNKGFKVYAFQLWGSIWPNVNLTQRSDQMSTLSKVVSHLATRCLPGGTSDQMLTWPKDLTKCQPDPKQYQTGPQDVSAWGVYIWPNVNLTWISITLGHMIPLPRGYIWSNVNLTQSSITLGHEMSLPGGYIWPKVNLTWSLTNCQPDQSLMGGTSKCRKVIWFFEHATRFCSCFTEVFSYPRPIMSESFVSQAWSMGQVFTSVTKEGTLYIV